MTQKLNRVRNEKRTYNLVWESTSTLWDKRFHGMLRTEFAGLMESEGGQEVEAESYSRQRCGVAANKCEMLGILT